MTAAARPFVFYTSVPLVELTGERARNLWELAELVERADISSIYFHTHHYVREHHFLSQEYPSDFAYWVAEILQEKALGEKLAFVDVRNFSSIQALREEILSLLRGHLGGKGNVRDVSPGLEFYFRRTINIVVPAGHTASTLVEFRDCLQRVDNNSLYFHLIESRLRDGSPGNDFSGWLLECLGKERLAAQMAEVDPYGRTLDETRQRLLNLVDRELAKERVAAKIASYPQTTDIAKLVREGKLFQKIRDVWGEEKTL